MVLLDINQEAGGLLNVHRGYALQNGSGLFGSLFRGLRKLIPKLTSAGKSAAKATGQVLKKAAQSELGKSLQDIGISSVTNAAADYVTGSEDPKKNIDDGLKKAKQEIAKALRKQGSKRKSNNQNGSGILLKKKKNRSTINNFNLFTPSP